LQPKNSGSFAGEQLNENVLISGFYTEIGKKQSPVSLPLIIVDFGTLSATRR